MISATQLAALRYLIVVSENGDELAKRIAILLVERSDNLTKSICLSLVEDREGYGAEEISDAAHSLDGMVSSGGSTHINEVLLAIGCNLKFSMHYGDYDPARVGNPFDNDGQFAGMPEYKVARPGLARNGLPMRYTFWLALAHFSHQARLVAVSRAELEAIELTTDGLYNHVVTG